MDEDWRMEAHQLIKEHIVGIVEGMGAKVELEISRFIRLLICD